MHIRRFFSVTEHTIWADLALLVMRVVVGLAFMFHGWRKIQNPLGWMGEDSWAPGILQALAALSEFGGGLALILGLLVPLAAFGIACTMAVAFSVHAFVRGDPFVGRDGSFELPSVFFTIAVVLLTIGPGRFSLDRVIFGPRRRVSRSYDILDKAHVR